MKKITVLFCIAFMLLMFAGCSNVESQQKENKGITVHFKKPISWPNEIYIYYYKDESVSVGYWPGVQMEYEHDDWYVYTIKDDWNKECKVMFFGDDEHRSPKHMEPGFPVWEIGNSYEMWYYKNKWYKKNPEK